MAFSEKEPKLKLGVRYKERKDDPPPGLQWHKFNAKDDGITLATLAQRYGVRWVDIALYNFRTDELAEINWYLRRFAGCKKTRGDWYIFDGTETPGMLLVPERPASLSRAPVRSVDGVRNGNAKLDTKVQVFVHERLATGLETPVSGKWLYVFSASDGVDFGFDGPAGSSVPGPSSGVNNMREPAYFGRSLPQDAFKLRFAGEYPLKNKATKLEYEIYVTAQNPSTDNLADVVAEKSIGKTPRYNIGNKWHFLSDPTLLSKATTEPRTKRTDHAFRNTEAITVELFANRRYYFLLSPVQLGPAALSYAMEHPRGLTPLLKPDTPSDPPSLVEFKGPTLADIDKGVVRLGVIDPYAWAEDLVVKLAADMVQLQEWANERGGPNSKSETLQKLEKDTSWSTKHFTLARLLKTIHDKSSSDIAGQFKDADKWRKDLHLWETELVQRNAEINAAPHQDVAEALAWMSSHAHRIIEVALLSDATAGSDQDALDIGRGILHWAICTQYMFAVKPGVDFLRDVFRKRGTALHAYLLQHLDDLDAGRPVKLTPASKTALRVASPGLVTIRAIRDLVSNSPYWAPGVSRDDYLKKLADDGAKRRDAFIKWLNENKLTPFEVRPLQAPPMHAPDGPPSLTAWAPALNSMLDLGDKVVTYIVEPGISIPRDQGRLLNWLADLEQFADRKGLRKQIAFGSGWTLKAFAVFANGYNLVQLVNTARNDYQKVNPLDVVAASAGLYGLVYDLATEVEKLVRFAVGSTKAELIFAPIVNPAAGPKWGVGVSTITTTLGKLLSRLNTVAVIVSGALTMYATGKSFVDAVGHGEYTAAAMYTFGFIGGAMQVTGGIFLFASLVSASGAGVTSTGVGAPIGVILIVIGTLISAIAALIVRFFTKDDYEKLAYKSFLGKKPNGKNIDAQTKDLIDLLGRFTLITQPLQDMKPNAVYAGGLRITVNLGFITEGSTIEVALRYGTDGTLTSSTLKLKEDSYGNRRLERTATSDGPKLFNPRGSASGITDSQVNYWVDGLRWDPSKGPLHTSVTVVLAEWKNLIRARKKIARQDYRIKQDIVRGASKEWYLDVDEDPVVAAGVD